MKQHKWVNRKFSFNHTENIFPSIIERLEGTPIRLIEKLKHIAPAILSERQENTWSIKENIGHLTDLEELWQGRLEDILSGKEYMRAWDVENRKTTEANHNDYSIQKIVDDFQEVRNATVRSLKELTEEQIFKTALHPRLHQPMRMMDLFQFVAEHDDHHLARITEIATLFRNE